jgi:hypothetical protein
MSDTPKDDEAKFNETLKRMLSTPPKPHKTSGGPKPAAHGSDQKKDQERKSPKARGKVD